MCGTLQWINEIAESDDEGDAFRKEKLEFLALTETKLKKNREVSWCRVGLGFLIFSKYCWRRGSFGGMRSTLDTKTTT